MSTTHKQLDAAAIQSHRRGDTWNQFWPTVAGDVAAAEPWDLSRHRQLVRRLSLLVTAGNLNGSEPVPNGWSEPMPWEIDDQAQSVPAIVPHDTRTAARCLWQPEQ